MEAPVIFATTSLCRTCLAPTIDLTSLFDVVSVANRTEPLTSLLLQCTSIQVTEHDTFPQSICGPCLDRLTQAYSFRETCYESHDRLTRLYGEYLSVAVKVDESNHHEAVLDGIKPEDAAVAERIEEEEEEELEPANNIADSETFVNETKAEAAKGSEVTSAGKYECPACHKAFQSKYTLNRHRKIHSEGAEGLQCKVCLRQFSRLTDVKRHMNVHTGAKPYVCNVCGMAFTQSGSLRQHQRRAHSGFGPPQEKRSGEKGARTHLCSVCGKWFKDSSGLTIHMRRHSGEKPYVCKVCGMSFVSRGRLTSHARVHTGERPFTCTICGQSFAQSSVIGRHLKSHSGEKPHGCDACPKTFTTLYYLRIHRRLHTGEKPHECPVCRRSFSDPKNLKHHRLVHSGARPHLCTVCGKRFRRNHHLKTHMNVHGVK